MKATHDFPGSITGQKTCKAKKEPFYQFPEVVTSQEKKVSKKVKTKHFAEAQRVISDDDFDRQVEIDGGEYGQDRHDLVAQP